MAGSSFCAACKSDYTYQLSTNKKSQGQEIMFSKKLAQNLLLATFTLISSILMAEGFLRYYKPYSALRAGYKMHTNNPIELTIFNTVDPKFGFRPILGNALYNSYGTKNNTYSIEKRPDVKQFFLVRTPC